MPHLCLHPRCLSAAVATIPNSAASSPIPIRRCIRPSSFSEPGTGAMNRRQGPAASTRLRHDRCQLATSPSGGIHALVPLPKFLKRQPADSTHGAAKHLRTDFDTFTTGAFGRKGTPRSSGRS
ncbi:hypothetical protein BRADI_5g01602v3 [Brachypodium distachyon]|uniref:Uncharacterized protein n=1 Tax=Brachypodium distachyon TaxID=15368 RepID=A0A2K2CEW3_BRADI|nr:hypothetical protein BRADI_5g01602v3 [Brachypodium distachyon]PNT60563.1 hypothetical protein BRADI_5g01602v3 [Brachypodium distachyon]PNT60565.1 hypothetical protein BRADI_5g01602v3 [Brachypodium distachyon]